MFLARLITNGNDETRARDITGGSGKRSRSGRCRARRRGKRRRRGECTANSWRICTYLQSVQVNVVERAVDARCQIMRHLDMPLALPPVISLSSLFARSLELADYFENTVRTILAVPALVALVLFLRPLPIFSPSSAFSRSLSLSLLPSLALSSPLASRTKIQGRRKERAKTHSSHQHYKDPRSTVEH